MVITIMMIHIRLKACREIDETREDPPASENT